MNLTTEQIKVAQTIIGVVNDGIIGNKTREAVKKYQAENQLPVTGEFDDATIIKMGLMSSNRPITFVEMSIMKDGSFVKQTSKKLGICLHHTAGNHNPFNVKRVWENDDRGRVATHFIIGGISETNDNQHDGKILQVIPMENWGYHIATSRMGFSGEHNDRTSASYIGIEVCNWGMLELKNGVFYNYVGGVVPSSQVCTLDTPFRTYKYWHKYTNAQIQALEKLICMLIETHKFDISEDFEGEINSNWLELSWNALAHKRVLTTHTNFEYGKFDMFPQPELLEMLKRIYAKYSK